MLILMMILETFISELVDIQSAVAKCQRWSGLQGLPSEIFFKSQFSARKRVHVIIIGVDLEFIC